MGVLNPIQTGPAGAKGEKGEKGGPGEVSAAELAAAQAANAAALAAKKFSGLADVAAAEAPGNRKIPKFNVGIGKYDVATISEIQLRVFHLADFGAKGDGVTNDLPAIEAALKAAEESGGGQILFFGRHVVTGTLEWKVNNTQLVGLPGAELIGVFGAGTQCIVKNNWAVGNEKLAIVNLTVKRVGGNTQHGVLLNGVTDFLWQGGGITGPGSIVSGALAISAIGPELAAILPSKGIRITGCRFVESDNFGVQIGWVQNVAIIGNTFDNCYREAIGVEPFTGSTAENITITGNAITTGTVPAGGTQTGVVIVTGNSGGTILGVTITGNTVLGTLVVAANQMPGIAINGTFEKVKGIVVKGNIVRNMNGSGIKIGSADSTEGVIVANNTVLNCNLGENAAPNGCGIQVRAARKCIFEGNYVEGVKHNASLEESSSPNNNRVVGNFFRDATETIILAASTVVYLNGTKKPTGVAENSAAIIVALKELGLFA